MMRSSILTTLIATALAAFSNASAQTYRPSGQVSLGQPDRWDYVVFDAPSSRVYVAHGDRVTAVDARAAKVVGEVTGIPGGTHGVAISTATGNAFTDDGKVGQVIAFDPSSFKITKRLKGDDDADGMVFDTASGHVFIVNGDPGTLTVVDPKAGSIIATVKAGEKMEYLASDDHGTLYVAGEANGDLIKVDTRSNKIIGKWAAADCKSPHGLALDRANGRVFMGCVNSEMIVMDTMSGRVVTKLAIGKGSDAIAFDPVRKRVFSSNGTDGTVTVYQQTSADGYKPLESIRTAVSARTMAVDPRTGRLFIAAADADPSPVLGGRPQIHPGTLRLMMFDPVK